MAAVMDPVLEEKSPKTSKVRKNVDKNLLDMFWDLSQIQQSFRVDAANSMIRLLHAKQKILSEEAQNGGKSSELEYTIERLVRGLASPRQAARNGFCLVLREILKLFLSVTVEDVVQHVEKHLSFHNKLEKRHTTIGRLMAYTAIIRSGRLKDDPYISFIVLNLYDLSAGKAYMQQFTHKLMLDLYSQIDAEQFKELLWPDMKKKLSCGWEKCSPDTMWHLLLCIKMFPSAVGSKFLQKNWGSDDLLADENLTHWQLLLKQSTAAHPQLHPLCSEFLDLALQKKLLQHIWNTVVDDNLCDSGQSEKTCLGFMLLRETLVKSKKKKIVKTVLSTKLCSALARSYLNLKNPLNPAATELVSFLSTFVTQCSDYQVQVAVLKAFLQQPRTSLLEQVLKKKEIVSMISHFTPEAVQAYCELLKDMVFDDNDKCRTEEESDIEDHKRHIAVFQIGNLVSHQAVISDVEWRLSVTKFLFLHAFFIVNEPTTDDVVQCAVVTAAFPPSLRQAFTNSFTKALDSLNRKIETSLPPLQQLLQFLQSIVEYADALIQVTNSSLSPLFPSEKILASWKKMKSAVQKLGKQSKKDGKINESNAFQVLFLQLGLQLFQDHEHIPNTLEELEICCKNALKLRKSQSEVAADDDEGPPWIQVVVDILLSLLSQPSHHMRCVVNSVFSLVCPFVTAEALQLILDVINPEKEVEENPLVDDDSADEEGEVEFESGSSSDDDDDDDDEKASDKDGKVDDDFKSKLQKVLGTADDVSDAESEIMLTDSEMFKLDATISEVFRSRKKMGHTKLTSEQRTLLFFRIRCLDLITNYLRTERPMYIIIQIIKPVLSAYESYRHQRHQDTLSRKALSTLKQISKIKKFQNYENVEGAYLETIMDDMMSRAHKETDTSISKILYHLCLFIVLCERKLKAPEKNSDQELKLHQLVTVKKYLVALDDFVKRSNSHMIPEMFIIFMNACPEHAWDFLEPLETYAFDDSVRLYRKSQCLGLILSAIKFSKGQKYLTTESWLERFESLVSKTIKALTSVLKGSDIKPLYTTELLSILATVPNVLKEREVSILQKHSELLPLLTSMTPTQCRRLTNNGNHFRKQLIKLLGGEENKKKRKYNPETEETQDEATDVSQNKTVDVSQDEAVDISQNESVDMSQNEFLGNGKSKLTVPSSDSETDDE